MSDSLPWIIIPSFWINVYTVTGITPGAAVELCNMGTDEITVCVHATIPTSSSIGLILSPQGLYGMAAYVTNGASGLWARSIDDGTTSYLSVQEKA